MGKERQGKEIRKRVERRKEKRMRCDRVDTRKRGKGRVKKKVKDKSERNECTK